MRLMLKPNYKKLSFQQLADFYNRYLGGEDYTYLEIKEGKCFLLRKNGDVIDEINEKVLREFFVEEVEKKDISCFDFFFNGK